MNCTACGSLNTRSLGVYRPYTDYSVEVSECNECGARFVPRDSQAHELLHSRPSSYSSHSAIAERARTLVADQNTEGLRGFLGKRNANLLVMNEVDELVAGARILEIGCSKGYLTAYSIAKKLDILGVDVSPTAVADARGSFGDFFCVAEDSRIEAGAPYDLIYHVGTIGCVDDPAAMTRSLLGMLKTGGKLVFNAPNVNACHATGRMWLTTPPPDLVTLFKPEYWASNFQDLATTKISTLKANRSTKVAALRQARQSDAKTALLNEQHSRTRPSTIRNLVRRLSAARLLLFSKDLPHDYGIHVTMCRK